MQIVELEMVPLSLRPVLQRLYDMKTTQSALREGVLFSTKRNNYYYDTGTGKVIVLDDDTSYIFRVLFDPALSAETFLISLTKVDPNAVKNLLQTIDAERLFQRPPLLSMGKEIAAGVTDTEQKVEQIILEVTEQCNFRCKYCVYSEDFSGNRDFGNRRMPTEIAFKAIDWALENSGAKLAITFYGGEPLLNFKLMKAVIERSQAKRGNKEIVYSFTSNMSLMTREIATYLAQVPNLYIMASIDGPRTVHDAYRVYANDAPTFEDSIGGLRILADAYAGSHMPVNINAVLTPPFGFEKLEQVNAYFESLDWLPATCHVNITYPSYGTCPGLDEYYDKITGNPKYALHGMCNPLMIWQQRKAETDGLDAYKARNIYYHSIFDDLVKINNRIIVDEPTLRRGLNGCCVPGKKRLYVTATGEYKACERIGSSPSIGNVDEGVDRELIVKKYVEEFAAQSKDICDKCLIDLLTVDAANNLYRIKMINHNLYLTPASNSSGAALTWENASNADNQIWQLCASQSSGGGSTGGSTTITMPVNANQNYSGNSSWIINYGCAVCCGVDLASWKKNKSYTISDFANYYDEANGYYWTGPDNFSCSDAISLASLNEAQTIEKIRSYVKNHIPVACHAVGSGSRQHWFVAYELTGESGGTWATAGIKVLDPYNSNSGSTEGRRVTILEAMQTSHVTLGVDRIRIPN